MEEGIHLIHQLEDLKQQFILKSRILKEAWKYGHQSMVKKNFPEIIHAVQKDESLPSIDKSWVFCHISESLSECAWEDQKKLFQTMIAQILAFKDQDTETVILILMKLSEYILKSGWTDLGSSVILSALGLLDNLEDFWKKSKTVLEITDLVHRYSQLDHLLLLDKTASTLENLPFSFENINLWKKIALAFFKLGYLEKAQESAQKAVEIIQKISTLKSKIEASLQILQELKDFLPQKKTFLEDTFSSIQSLPCEEDDYNGVPWKVYFFLLTIPLCEEQMSEKTEKAISISLEISDSLSEESASSSLPPRVAVLKMILQMMEFLTPDQKKNFLPKFFAHLESLKNSDYRALLERMMGFKI
jgi:tetratricopeptide (TPR) repeat protein